jgi:hypothetical protein
MGEGWGITLTAIKLAAHCVATAFARRVLPQPLMRGGGKVVLDKGGGGGIRRAVKEDAASSTDVVTVEKGLVLDRPLKSEGRGGIG